MSYFVDSKYVAAKLAAFLSKARSLGFSFSAVTLQNGRQPRERIEDVSNIMTWEKDIGTESVSFFRAGVRQFSYGLESSTVVKIVSNTICSIHFTPAFYVDPNGHLRIFNKELESVWKQL